jgi:hypothetical protein
MFGPSIFSVFRSRWKALWWGASILLLAYCSIPSAEDSAQQSAPNAADMKAVQDALKDAGNASRE